MRWKGGKKEVVNFKLLCKIIWHKRMFPNQPVYLKKDPFNYAEEVLHLPL